MSNTEIGIHLRDANLLGQRPRSVRGTFLTFYRYRLKTRWGIIERRSDDFLCGAGISERLTRSPGAHGIAVHCGGIYHAQCARTGRL
jgi:hypothetical protein